MKIGRGYRISICYLRLIINPFTMLYLLFLRLCIKGVQYYTTQLE